MLDNDIAFTDKPMLAMPPRQSNEKFLDGYEVVFILDDREKFGFVSSFPIHEEKLYLLL
jgi:crossover junction endonuclease MUS81